MEEIGTRRTSVLGYATLLTVTAALSAAAYALYSAGSAVCKLLAIVPTLLAAVIVFGLVRNMQFGQ